VKAAVFIGISFSLHNGFLERGHGGGMNNDVNAAPASPPAGSDAELRRLVRWVAGSFLLATAIESAGLLLTLVQAWRR
jgi:hypothetical protein